MSEIARRRIVRWTHLVLGVPIAGYVYSPFDQLPSFAPAVRFFFLPAIVLSGLWLWKGAAVRRLLTRRAPVS